MHGTSNPQSSAQILGEIFSLNRDWYSTVNNYSNAENWINNYFNSDPSSVSIGKSIIPYPSNPWDNFIFSNIDTRINVTLPISTNTSTVLQNQKKIGLKFRLNTDEINPSDGNNRHDYRCYWSPYAYSSPHPSVYIPFANPILSYYYYVWGDTTLQYDYSNDPSVNNMITKLRRVVIASYCKSKFERKAMNPYVEGVLGNWRVDSTYAYYGERKETDPTSPIDNRTAGTIKNYKTFWNFANTAGKPIYSYLFNP